MAQYSQREETGREHLLELRAYLGLTPFSRSHLRQAVQALAAVAVQTDKGVGRAGQALDHLRRQHVIDAINLGLSKMAESCPGTTHAQLSWLQAFLPPILGVQRAQTLWRPLRRVLTWMSGGDTVGAPMARLRRALRRIAVTWLLCQAAGLTLTPTIAAFGSADELMECTCADGDHAVCPMHHKPAPGLRICVMTGTGDTDVAVPTWLMHVGLIPTRSEASVPDYRELLRPLDRTTASLRSTPPDPPPPWA